MARASSRRKQYTRASNPARLMSITTDYDTVGQLYNAINDGLAAMAADIGEDKLMVGDPTHQIGPDVAALPNLKVVRCLKTARIAIDAIVRQGEGADESEMRSHYQRFLAIKREYDAARAARPAFQPARPAAVNPVMRRPPTPEGKLWITAEPAASLLDLGNALYNHCLRCLSLAYTGVNPATQRVLVQAGIDLMRLLTPVASRLTTLPANAEQPGCTAGLSFATLRSSAALPAQHSSLAVLAERARDIGEHASQLAAEHGELAELLQDVIRGVTAVGDRLSRAASPDEPAPVAAAAAVAAPAPAAARVAAAAPAPAPAATTTNAPRQGPPMPQPLGHGVQLIPGAAIDIVYSGRRCIHSRHCVLGLPGVFKANVEGPWIDPDAASTEQLLTVAHMCPSGAIQYRRHDGGPEEAAPPVNLLQLRENGPLGFRAQIVLDGKPIGMHALPLRRIEAQTVLRWES